MTIEIVVFPMKNGGSFHRYVNVYQRVSDIFRESADPYYHILSYIIIYYHILSYIIIYYHILSYIIIYYHILSYIIIIIHCNPSSIIIHPFRLIESVPQAYNEPADNGGRPLTGWRIQRAAGQSLSFRGVGPL